MKAFLIITLLLFNPVLFFAQTSMAVRYEPFSKDSLVNFINRVSDKKITKFNSKYKKDVKAILLDRNERMVEKIKDSGFIFDSKINQYVGKIFKEISASNPSIVPSDFYFLVDKSGVPNASCYWNGIFTINLGLLNFIQSDDELAAVIAHEIAHYQLNHSENSMLRNLDLLHSKQTKKKAKAINRAHYGKNRAYLDLMEELNYNFTKRSRKDELQADSLGFVFFKKTRFQKRAFVTALENLKNADSIVFNENAQLKVHFNFESYPFKEAWLVKDEALFNIKESASDYKFDKDSMKTHPDIPLRIEVIKKMLIGTDSESKSSNDSLPEIKKRASLLVVQSAIDAKQIDFALYQTLVLYNRKEVDEKTFCAITAKLLQSIYQLKEQHKFGRYISTMSAFSDEVNLDELRQFLHNLELKNIRKIGMNFCQKHADVMGNDSDFIQVKSYFNQLNQK